MERAGGYSEMEAEDLLWQLPEVNIRKKMIRKRVCIKEKTCLLIIWTFLEL